ncbi:hypothetical protein PoB_007196400 [Plakobranchus ocellatus]|uniref:Uncharacterized protein n=1 Tax=Plakobranchus ocellatus TaxID=259542 RepID=A0AAV4DMP8_9GAST|nr:hypothetical protein PoB_007196400 [Plakobranchus ocellatus]
MLDAPFLQSLISYISVGLELTTVKGRIKNFRREGFHPLNTKPYGDTEGLKASLTLTKFCNLRMQMWPCLAYTGTPFHYQAHNFLVIGKNPSSNRVFMAPQCFVVESLQKVVLVNAKCLHKTER